MDIYLIDYMPISCDEFFPGDKRRIYAWRVQQNEWDWFKTFLSFDRASLGVPDRHRRYDVGMNGFLNYLHDYQGINLISIRLLFDIGKIE